MAIPFVRVLQGVSTVAVRSVNDTYRGQVLYPNGTKRQAIIKDLDRQQLANELLVFVLAKAAGMPIPDACIGVAQPSVLTPQKAPTTAEGHGIFFISTDMMAPNLAQVLTAEATFDAQKVVLDKLADWDRLGELYAFDSWVANIDRHMGNILLGPGSDIWLIDHGHSLTGPTWEPSGLDAAGAFENRLGDWLTQHVRQDRKANYVRSVAAFSEMIEDIDVPDAVKSSLIENLLPPEYVSAVRDFLRDRREHVEMQASSTLGLPRLVS
ncbi:HipA family kinase [Salipiger mangrovisoli]|uniref:HipA-like kinase domain-containing protein n=1 Tax=Salipiger mangrovisoli TaxID=2865933 RepID=A0ABR9XBU8_9RHOB|nr:HipA family kinase [Salipiger mangrovisoli]MBE9640973.1 hypothetical protein [Salipiger mangrovisoli]